MEKQKQDGGAAFPGFGPWYVDGKLIPQVPGMSLRDYFAGQALVGLLAGARDHFPIGAPSKQVAAAADDLADAMIAERERGTDASD